MNLFTKLDILTDGRVSKAIDLIDKIEDLVVTRQQFIELSAFVGQYGCYVDPDFMTCTCVDYRVRKIPCKHIFAVVLSAYNQGLINEMDVMLMVGGILENEIPNTV